MKKILITGKNSYIGISLERWLLKKPNIYAVDTIDMKDEIWREIDFSIYDVVFHVAGIAHVSADPKMEDLYYRVNRDLAIETAEKAKKEKVKQFIFMSSIIVYGDSSSYKYIINSNTEPNPSNFYGDSKLQAEKGINELLSDDFSVATLRPPMVYGKGSKGNYPKLAKLAKKTPVFPDIENQRSMLHIDNLCEFIKIIIDEKESGTFFPQNRNYVKTSEMVRLIAEAHGRKVWMTTKFNWIIKLFFNHRLIKKIYGNLIYDMDMSRYDKKEYQIRNLKDSIELTEK